MNCRQFVMEGEQKIMETNWSEQLQKAGSLGIVILGNILYALAG